MPRYARLVRPGTVFHITARGNYRRQVFFDSEDYETYLSLLGKHAASFQVRLLGWCLMSNHVHPAGLSQRRARPGANDETDAKGETATDSHTQFDFLRAIGSHRHSSHRT